MNAGQEDRYGSRFRKSTFSAQRLEPEVRPLTRQLPAGYLGLTINRLHNWHRGVPESPKPISQERRVSFMKSDANIMEFG